MILSDRYDVLICPKKSRDLGLDEIQNFFENLIKNNQKIFIPKYIRNNMDSFDGIKSNIFHQLGSYIKLIRKNIRDNIRRNSTINLVDTYINLITSFNQKIYDLEYFSVDEDFKKKCYNQIFTTLIGDPVTNTIFSKDILNLKQKNKIKYLFQRIKKYDDSFYNDWCITFLKNTIFNHNVSDIYEEKPIPNYILEYLNFKKWGDIMFTYVKHFDFIDLKLLDEIFLVIYVRKFNCFFQIIQNDSVQNIIHFLNNSTNKKAINYILEHSQEEKKTELNMKTLNIFLSRYETNKNLKDICDIFITISENYPKTFDSFLLIFAKEIAKLISKNNLFDDMNNIMTDYILSDVNSNCDYGGKLFKIISHIDDKNIIFNKYHHELMLRLLQNGVTTDHINSEMNLLDNHLSKCFSSSQRYKLKRTIEDVLNSIKINNDIHSFSEESNILDVFSIITTSYNIWDSKVLDISTRFDEAKTSISKLQKLFKFYSKYYSESYSNKRYLNWYLHTGAVDISYYLNNNKEVNLLLLPIQALCLEEFDYEIDYISIENFLNFKFMKSYERKEREKVLEVFINNNILILEEDKIKLNLNLEFEGNKKQISLIDGFFEVSSMPDIWKEQIDIDIANNKVDVVKTKINHYLKNNILNYSELFESCKDIKSFEVTRELMDEALLYMIKYDFIKLHDDKYEKLFY